MKTRKNRKLVLDRETLRTLQPAEVDHVRGAAWPTLTCRNSVCACPTDSVVCVTTTDKD
jgi:hypothetical protein